MKLLKTLNSTLKSKVNSSEKNISDTTTLIHINQYHAGKHNLEKILEMLTKTTDQVV